MTTFEKAEALLQTIIERAEDHPTDPLTKEFWDSLHRWEEVGQRSVLLALVEALQCKLDETVACDACSSKLATAYDLLMGEET